MKEKGKNKKRVVGVIGLATAICCMGIASVTVAHANNSNGTHIVYAAEANDIISENIEKWNNAIADLKRIGGVFSDANDYKDYMFAYIDATDAYAVISAQVTPEDYLVYEQAGLIIRKDADCYRFFSTSLAKLYKEENIHWSDKELYDSNVAHLLSLDSMKKDAIINAIVPSGAYEAMRVYADGEFARMQSAMDTVISDINNIYYNVNGKIVVNSKSSLDTVAASIKLIYGIEYAEFEEAEVAAIAKYITNLCDYDQALIDYQAIVTACEEIDTRIINAYDAFAVEGGEYFNKYYTQRAIIETLRVDHDALNRAPDDDATTLVTQTAKLVELESSLKFIDDSKIEVESLISAIPVDFDYTDAYIGAVNSAKSAFDALPEDLKAIADTEIADYSKLVTALAEIKNCSDKVDALIERANNLQTLYNEGSEKFSGEVNGVAKERAKLQYAKQQADFDDERGELLSDMQTKLNNLSEKIGPFIDAVLAIGEVKLSNPEIGVQITKAYTEYAKLTTTLEQNAVLGYKQILDQKKAALDELMAESNEWKAAVEAIVLGEKITTQDIANINKVESDLEQIKINNLDMYTVITTSGNIYGYTAYEALISARNNLFSDIAQLAIDMADLSTDLSVIVADPTTFNQAILNAKGAFEALDDTVKAEYFTNDTAVNKAAYDNYAAALNIYNEVAKLAGDIAGLYDITLVNMTKYDAIDGYNASYKLLSDENKAILNTQKINDDKTFKEVLDAATAKVNGLKADRDAWSVKVYALAGDIEKAKWEADLYSVNLTAVEELKLERVDLDNTDSGLDAVDTDFALIETIGKKRVTDLNNLIAILDAKPQLEKTDVATLKSIYDIYNNKLHETQKVLVNYSVFEVLYNKYVFAQNFDDAVLALYDDVVAKGNYTTEAPITVGILRSIYINFGSEMKSLIQEYDRIEEVEAAFKAHVEGGGVVLNLTGAYNELLAKIDAQGSNLSAEILTLSNKIVAIEKAYVEADTALKTALEEAYNAGDKELSDKLVELQGKLDKLKTDLEAADATLEEDIAKVREEIATVKSDLEELIGMVKTELMAEIATLEQALADAKAQLENADVANKAELQGKIDALTQALADAKAQLENADVANKTELLDKIGSLNKSLTIVTVVLAIVSGFAALSVVILFVKKKKAN